MNDWSNCPDVERTPGKVSGAWVLKGTRIPADDIVGNADYGYTPEQMAREIYEGLPVEAARRLIAYAKGLHATHPA